MKGAPLLLLLLVAAAGAAHAANPVSVASLINRLSSKGGLRLLNNKLRLYTDILKELGPSFAGTIFAPSDAAIKQAEAAGIVISSDILRNHIVPGPPAPINALNDAQIFVTSAGLTLQAKYKNGRLTIQAKGSSAAITNPDIMIGPAGYAVVHVIDNILLPYKPAKPLLPIGPVVNNIISGLLGGGTSKPGTGKPGTGKPIISIPGITSKPSGGSGGVQATNIDGATPAAAPMAAEEEAPMPMPMPTGEEPMFPDLITAATESNLTTLLAAVTIAGLTDELVGFNGTVLAPTDEAFATLIALLNVDINNLTTDQLAVLADVLKYHLIPAKAMAADLMDGQELETLLGEPVVVNVREDGVYFIDGNGGEAMVVAADVTAGDAVIHVINKVLIPALAEPTTPAPTPAPAPVSSASTLASAAAVAGSLLAAALLL